MRRLAMGVWASLALLLLGLLPGFGGTISAVEAHPAFDASPTATSTATTTPTPAPTPAPTLTLVSPSSGQGPVGARLTLSGAHWPASGVDFGAASSTSDCATPASWTEPIGHATPGATGQLTYTFTWPTDLPPIGTAYTLCALATGLTPASVSYLVRSALTPSLSLSNSGVAPGQSVTVSGANFIGVSSVDMSLTDTAGASHTLGKQTPAADGSFSLTYTPKATDLGQFTITASSPSEGGAPSALEASVTLNVQSALTPTAPPRPSPTPIVTPTSAPVAAIPTPPRLDLRAALVVALTLALLALAGSAFVIFFRLRAERRREEEQALRARTRRLPVAAGMMGDLESDTDPSILAIGGRRATGKFAAADDGDERYDEGYDAGWDEDDGPGPDWQPRPMTGSGPIFSDDSYPRAPDSQDASEPESNAPGVEGDTSGVSSAPSTDAPDDRHETDEGM